MFGYMGPAVEGIEEVITMESVVTTTALRHGRSICRPHDLLVAAYH
jgi:hypothetical protein